MAVPAPGSGRGGGVPKGRPMARGPGTSGSRELAAVTVPPAAGAAQVPPPRGAPCRAPGCTAQAGPRFPHDILQTAALIVPNRGSAPDLPPAPARGCGLCLRSATRGHYRDTGRDGATSPLDRGAPAPGRGRPGGLGAPPRGHLLVPAPGERPRASRLTCGFWSRRFETRREGALGGRQGRCPTLSRTGAGAGGAGGAPGAWKGSWDTAALACGCGPQC